jgi:hypothetical protein
VLGAYRVEKFFIQGSIGYNKALDSSPLSAWFLNSSFGILLDDHWALQWESDMNSYTFLNNGNRGSHWNFYPQVAFQKDDWFVNLGEQLNASPTGTTILMIGRDF